MEKIITGLWIDKNKDYSVEIIEKLNPFWYDLSTRWEIKVYENENEKVIYFEIFKYEVDAKNLVDKIFEVIES